MIQDIRPHVYDNAYRISRPGEDDYVLVYSEQSVFLSGSEDALQIPVYSEVKAQLTGIKGEFVYLFSVDERPYFLFFSREPFADLPLHKKPIGFIRKFEPAWMAFAAITGYQLSKWYHEHRFCGKCGQPTRRDEKERAMVCDGCKTIVYPKLSPAIIVGVTDGDRLLLTRYNGRPVKSYALVAGFVEIGETLEETVRREVMEEVGLRVKNIRYFGSQPWSFSDSLLVGFFADLDGSPKVTLDTEELSEGVWLPRQEIPPADPAISLTGTMIEAFRTGGGLQNP